MTNFDDKTGIHYGAISYHSVMPEALDDVFTQGDNLTYQEAADEAQSTLTKALIDIGLGEMAESIWSDIEDLWDGQVYQGDDEVYLYEQDGYKISNSPSLVCLFVEKSPWYTFARPCSPCVPNAGDLDNPEGLLKTYCLGPEWFEGEKSPYLVYSVANNTLVSSTYESTKAHCSESSVTVAASDTEGENR
jgi:hypothetical protein